MYVLIIEDDLILSEQLSQLFSTALDDPTIHQAYTIQDAERYLEQNSYPLISIDLELPDGNGLEFAKKYRQQFQLMQTDFFIVSGTYDLKTAYVAYDEAHCFKILPKPIVQSDFDIAIKRFMTKHSTASPIAMFLYETKSMSLRIPYSDILYFEVTLKTCTLYTLKDSYILGRIAIKLLLELVPQHEFLQIHRSIVINRSKIRVIDKQTGQASVKLNGFDTPLPIGKKFKNSL